MACSWSPFFLFLPLHLSFDSIFFLFFFFFPKKGPILFIPTIEMQVIEKRKAIPLDEQEGYFISFSSFFFLLFSSFNNLEIEFMFEILQPVLFQL